MVSKCFSFVVKNLGGKLCVSFVLFLFSLWGFLWEWHIHIETELEFNRSDAFFEINSFVFS